MVGLEHRDYAGKIEPIVSRLLENGDWVTIREAENYRLKPKPALVTVSIESAALVLAVEPEYPAESAPVVEHEQLMFDFEFDEPVNPDVQETANAPEKKTDDLPEAQAET